MNSESSQNQASKEKRPREEEGQEEEGQPDPQKQRTVATDTWEQIFDQAYKKYYYYNRRTGESVWERPEDAYVVPASSPLSSSSISSSSSLSSTATPSAIPGTDYTTIQVHETGFVEQGSNTNNGGLGEGVSENGLALSSQISEVAYLDRGFAPSDHMGQQMYEFFDPAQLERNRNEAKARKQALKVLLLLLLFFLIFFVSRRTKTLTGRSTSSSRRSGERRSRTSGCMIMKKASCTRNLKRRKGGNLFLSILFVALNKQTQK